MKKFFKLADKVMAYVFPAMVVLEILMVALIATFLLIMPTLDFISDIRWHNSGHPLDAKHPFYQPHYINDQVAAAKDTAPSFTTNHPTERLSGEIIVVKRGETIKFTPQLNNFPVCPICQGREKYDNKFVRLIWPIFNISQQKNERLFTIKNKSATSIGLTNVSSETISLMFKEAQPLKMIKEID